MAFNFGSGKAPAPSTGGFSFGTPAPASGPASGPAPAGGFSFGASGGTGFSFGSTGSAAKGSDAAPAPAFGFGSGASQPPKSGGNEGSEPPKTGGFSFGSDKTGAQSSTAATAPGAGFTFGNPKPTADKAGGDSSAPFSFGSAKSSEAPNNAAAPAASFGGAPAKNAAPAPFTFGAPAAPAAAPKTPSDSSKEGAKSAFSFGSSSAKPPSDATKPSFSFGSSAKPASGKTDAPPPAGFGSAQTPEAKLSKQANPTTPATPAPPNPVETPRQTAPPTTTPTTTTIQSPREPGRLEYQTLTVEQIINKFQAELEKDALQYMKESKRVAQYDAVLRDSQRLLSDLSQQTSTMMVHQTELERKLSGIGAFQKELEGNLEKLENHVSDLFDAQAHLQPVDSDLQRENAYSTALECEQKLQGLLGSLEGIGTRIASAQESAYSGEVGDVCRILNMHQMQLFQLERASRAMEHDIDQLSTSLANTPTRT